MTHHSVYDNSPISYLMFRMLDAAANLAVRIKIDGFTVVYQMKRRTKYL
jgi:hypothetical protein